MNADDYFSSGRAQVFVSVERQAIQSYLLDFDGHTVKLLYKTMGGRVLTYATFDVKGQLTVIEFWPKG